MLFLAMVYLTTSYFVHETDMKCLSIHEIIHESTFMISSCIHEISMKIRKIVYMHEICMIMVL